MYLCLNLLYVFCLVLLASCNFSPTKGSSSGLQNKANISKTLINCNHLGAGRPTKEAVISTVNQWYDTLRKQRLSGDDSLDLRSNIGILSMIVSSLGSDASHVAICDGLGRVQSVAIASFGHVDFVEVGPEKYLDEDIVGLSLLASKPNGYPDRVKGAGLEAMAEVFRQFPNAKAMALDPTAQARGFYKKFGFYFGEEFTIGIMRESFFDNYRAYYASCKP